VVCSTGAASATAPPSSWDDSPRDRKSKKNRHAAASATTWRRRRWTIPSERLAQQALRTSLAGRTSVIIAHWLSTVEIADRVLVMERGLIDQDAPRPT
jgi:hypothetical protein